MIKASPFFSVIIPAYNGASTLARTLDSILKQGSDYELIVVDDGSKDATREVVSTYGDQVAYYFQNNRGVCSARNFGARMAKGKFLVFVDADDWLSEKCLETYHIRASKDNVHLVLGIITYYSDKGVVEQVIKPRVEGDQYSYGLPGSFAISREKFTTVGGYDENLTYSENSDLFLRLQNDKIIAASETCIDIAEGVCKTLEHRATRSSRYSKKKYESAKYFLKKHESYFHNNPKDYLNFKRIEAFGAFQNSDIARARSIMVEIIRTRPTLWKSYLQYLIFCSPSLARFYYRHRL